MILKATKEITKESGDRLVDYKKDEWIDMNQKVKWGSNTYDLYKSPYYNENSEYVYITVSQPIKS